MREFAKGVCGHPEARPPADRPFDHGVGDSVDLRSERKQRRERLRGVHVVIHRPLEGFTGAPGRLTQPGIFSIVGARNRLFHVC